MENSKINKDYIHHQHSQVVSSFREVVFGMEDGMVSTLGAISGIAIGSQDQFTVVLAGCVIIAVESISMGMGSYISNLSDKEIKKRKLYEERQEIENFPKREAKELVDMYVKDGWPEDLARQMSQAASSDKKLMLKEMAYRELQVSLEEGASPVRGGIFMFFAYILGGLIPLFAYFILPISTAIYISIIITLIGLFLLGVGTTRYTKSNWFKSGIRIFVLGGIALLAGFIIGELANIINN